MPGKPRISPRSDLRSAVLGDVQVPRASTHAWSVRSARVCPGAPDGMPPAANGQTGRAVGPTTAAAAIHAPVEPRVPLTPDEVKNTMAFKILAQFKTPKDIR